MVTTDPRRVISQPAATRIETLEFSAEWLDGKTASYEARRFSIEDPTAVVAQTYYVTIYDPERLGDDGHPCPAYCDKDATRAETAGYVFAGKIIATHEAGHTGSIAGPGGLNQTLLGSA
jgi:hypothetical protein